MIINTKGSYQDRSLSQLGVVGAAELMSHVTFAPCEYNQLNGAPAVRNQKA